MFASVRVGWCPQLVSIEPGHFSNAFPLLAVQFFAVENAPNRAVLMWRCTLADSSESMATPGPATAPK